VPKTQDPVCCKRNRRHMMNKVTLRRKPNSNLLLATDGKVGIVVRKVSDMKEMGYQYVKNSRGEWVLMP